MGGGEQLGYRIRIFQIYQWSLEMKLKIRKKNSHFKEGRCMELGEIDIVLYNVCIIL